MKTYLLALNLMTVPATDALQTLLPPDTYRGDVCSVEVWRNIGSTTVQVDEDGSKMEYVVRDGTAYGLKDGEFTSSWVESPTVEHALTVTRRTVHISRSFRSGTRVWVSSVACDIDP